MKLISITAFLTTTIITTSIQAGSNIHLPTVIVHPEQTVSLDLSQLAPSPVIYKLSCNVGQRLDVWPSSPQAISVVVDIGKVEDHWDASGVVPIQYTLGGVNQGGPIFNSIVAANDTPLTIEPIAQSDNVSIEDSSAAGGALSVSCDASISDYKRN